MMKLLLEHCDLTIFIILDYLISKQTEIEVVQTGVYTRGLSVHRIPVTFDWGWGRHEKA